MSRRKRHTGAEFVIDHVWDFANVPDDRLNVCLREFALAVRVRRHMLSLLAAIGDEVAPGANIDWRAGPFRWKDDGEKLVTVKLLETPIPDGSVS